MSLKLSCYPRSSISSTVFVVACSRTLGRDLANWVVRILLCLVQRFLGQGVQWVIGDVKVGRRWHFRAASLCSHHKEGRAMEQVEVKCLT